MATRVSMANKSGVASKSRERTWRDEIDVVAGEHGGEVTTELIEQTARNPDSLLHARFPWDDARIGYQYRLGIARQLLHEYRSPDNPNIPKYIHVEIRRAYVDNRIVRDDRKLAASAIAEVLRDFEQFENKLRNYQTAFSAALANASEIAIGHVERGHQVLRAAIGGLQPVVSKSRKDAKRHQSRPRTAAK